MTKRQHAFPQIIARAPLLFAILLMGFTFTITQVMVIREFLVIFTGNELSIAIILANWLLLDAAGSWLWGKKVEDWGLKESGYAFLQFFIAVLLPLTIYGIRCLRDLMGLSIGEGASLLQIFFWTVPLLAPLGIANGIMFALACSLYPDREEKRAASIGRVYLLEALGAGAGGVLYTFFFIPLFGTFQVAFLLGTANLVLGLLLIQGGGSKGRTRWILSAVLGIFLVGSLMLLFPSSLQRIERSSMERLWRGLEVLQSRWSPYGNIVVGKREEQLTFFSNGIPICNVPVPDVVFMEEMAHYPLLLTPSPRAILIIGGGLGGIIQEILKHPVHEVHYTEIDPLIVHLIQANLTPLTRQELADPRVRIHILDGRFYVKNAAQKFDGIILNLPPPSTLEVNRFYTVDFFREVSSLLRKGGVLALSAPGSETYLGPEVRDLNLSLLRTLQQVFPSVVVIPGDINFLLASAGAFDGSAIEDLLIERLRERKIQTQFLNEFNIRRKLNKQRREWLEVSLERGGVVRLNRDSTPSGLYYGIAYWNAQFHPSLQAFWTGIGRLRFWHLGLLVLILGGGGFIWCKTGGAGKRKKVLIWVTTTTGFFGTAMSILLIFSFQTLYGYAYQWIGLLIAAFMLGLALGSWVMTTALERIKKFRGILIGTEILTVLFTVLGMLLLAVFYSAGMGTLNLWIMKPGFLLLSIISGFWVGIEFPLASRIFSNGGKERLGRTAGLLYASDLLGAWAGSLLVGVVLIPVLGMLSTCGVIILLKLSSLALIIIFSGNL
ncbi:MAG TPA: fused MFS/spermidine synthase [Thermodesulfobacteriota bacterium]|nr:fused MFS/spermidine synthase [Thermodesulfobacteriota bacterium]